MVRRSRHRRPTVKTLRFGGKGLPPGTHTFYYTTDADPRLVDKVKPGDSAPFDLVVDAQGYIDRGQASIETAAATDKKK